MALEYCFPASRSRRYFYLMKKNEVGAEVEAPGQSFVSCLFYLGKNAYFLKRARYNIGHLHSFAEEDWGLDLQDPISCASAPVDCVIE